MWAIAMGSTFDGTSAEAAIWSHTGAPSGTTAFATAINWWVYLDTIAIAAILALGAITGYFTGIARAYIEIALSVFAGMTSGTAGFRAAIDAGV